MITVETAGSAVAIFFGFPLDGASTDEYMRERETSTLGDIRRHLEDSGIHVVIAPSATAEDFLRWIDGSSPLLEGRTPVGLIWSAHGDRIGGVQTADGSPLSPTIVAGNPVHPALRLVMFSSCHTGLHARQWYEALARVPTIIGYDEVAVLRDVLEFYSATDRSGKGLRDVLSTYLLNPALVA